MVAGTFCTRSQKNRVDWHRVVAAAGARLAVFCRWRPVVCSVGIRCQTASSHNHISDNPWLSFAGVTSLPYDQHIPTLLPSPYWGRIPPPSEYMGEARGCMEKNGIYGRSAGYTGNERGYTGKVWRYMGLRGMYWKSTGIYGEELDFTFVTVAGDDDIVWMQSAQYPQLGDGATANLLAPIVFTKIGPSGSLSVWHTVQPLRKRGNQWWNRVHGGIWQCSYSPGRGTKKSASAMT